VNHQNTDGLWHRDVFIEEAGTIVGYVTADTDDLFAGDPEIAKAILRQISLLRLASIL
jgi:hypothetical protein